MEQFKKVFDMQESGLPFAKKRRVKSEKASACPTYDLSGAVRKSELLTRKLNALTPTASEQLALSYRKLFNDNAIKVTFSPWYYNQGDSQGVERWLAKGHEHYSCSVYGGFSSQSLQQLSSVFFGEKQASAAAEPTPLSATAERLGHRLLDAFISTLFPPLQVSASDWRSRDMVRPPSGHLVFTELTMASEDWSIRWICCFPAELVKQEERPPQVIGRAPLETALRQVDVRLTVRLAQLRMTLQELGAMSAGDILPLNLQQQVPARIGQQVCLWGQVAEQRGQLVFKITERGSA